MKKALIYCRLSLAGEDEESLKRQRERGEHEAKQNGWTPVLMPEQAGHRSGMSEQRRPVWRKVKQLLQSDPSVAALIVQDTARATRDLDLLQLLAGIAARKQSFIAWSEPTYNISPETAFDDTDELQVGVQALFNRIYARRLSRAQKTRIQHVKQRGGTVGKIPLGLQRNKAKQYEPSDESYPYKSKKRTYLSTVLRLLELYKTGDVGAPDIARRLVLEGYCWRSNAKEPIPVQEYHVGWTIKILESYEGCVPKALLAKCIQVRDKRSRRTYNGNKRELPPPLLWRILFCAKCKTPYITSSNNVYYTVKSGQRKMTLSMRYSHREYHCHQMKSQYTFKHDRFDNQMLEIITWVLSQSEEEKEAAARAMSTVQEVVPVVDAEQIKAQQSRLKALFVRGHLSEADYVKEYDALEALLPSITPAAEVMTYEQARQEIEDLPAAILYTVHDDPTLANQIIRELIERVEVADGQIQSFKPVAKYLPLFANHPLCAR